MSLVLLVGGAGSGKSRLATDLAARESKPVVVIATAEPRDEEMASRIAGHRAERPSAWTTVEEAVDLESAIESAPEEAAVIVDCLTLWVSNLMEQNTDVEERSRSAAAAAAGRTELVVAVTNEVGSGIVPTSELGRRFRDVLGTVNATWAAHADRTLLVVAGKVLPLQDADG